MAAVEPDVVRWWEVLGTLKWGIMCIMQANAHLSGVTPQPRAGGHRAAGLRERTRPVPGHRRATGEPSRHAHRPSSWSKPSASGSSAMCLPATDGRLQFHTRVAINVLAMVERELVLGPAHEAAHLDRLRSLGVADDAELAAAIRSANSTIVWPRCARWCGQSVRDKLAVANPKYLTSP